jgi:hypothetical protein
VPGLARFRDPTTSLWRYWLRQGQHSAEVNPDWGRYLALEHAAQHVLAHTPADELAVPLGALLPAPLAATVGLCSGQAPRLLRAGPRRSCLVFSSVPRFLAERVADKLSQALTYLPSFPE